MLFELQDPRSCVCEYVCETRDLLANEIIFLKIIWWRFSKDYVSIETVRLNRAVSEVVISLRQAPGYQARLSSKSDMINTRRGRCDYRFVAADGSVSNLSLSWVIALSKCAHRAERTAAAVNNSMVCVSTPRDKWSLAQIKVLSLNGIGNFCRNHRAFDDLPNY